MQRTIALALLLAGCTAHEPVEPTPAPTPTPTPTPPPEPPPPFVDVATASCRLQALTAPPPPLHRWLRGVSSQFFHAGHNSSGFDANDHDGRYAWFDRETLDTPVLAPAGTRVWSATRSTLLVTALADGQLGAVDRVSGTPRWLGPRLLPEFAGETSTGVKWVLARTSELWSLVRLADDVQVTALPIDENNWDAQLTVTADDRVVVAWLEHDGEALRIRMLLEPDLTRPVVVDEVKVPEQFAKMSRISTVNLAIAPDGPDGVAMAWRPLLNRVIVESDMWIPLDPYDAEVRWFHVDRDGKRVEPTRRQPTKAHPRNGGSGLGPIGVPSNGLTAGSLGGRAVFVWHDERGVLAARADHEHASWLAPSASDALLLLRPGELVLLHSSEKVGAFTLRCTDPT